MWRHTCASHLIQNNANLRHVQELLGHRSLATAERYLRLTITDLKQVKVSDHSLVRSSSRSNTRRRARERTAADFRNETGSVN